MHEYIDQLSLIQKIDVDEIKECVNFLKLVIDRFVEQNGNFISLSYGDIKILEIIKVLFFIIPEDYQNCILSSLTSQKWNLNAVEPLIVMITDIYKKIEPQLKEKLFIELQISFLSFTNTDKFDKLYTLLFNCYSETKDFKYIDVLRLLWNNPIHKISQSFLTDLLIKNIVFIIIIIIII